MHQISVGNITIDVIRKDIKNLHLAVYPPDGRVRIATPLKIDDEAVRLFAVSKLAWIKKQRLKFENQERQSKREYVSGETHFFFGTRYRLHVIYHNAASKVEIKKKSVIDLYVREGSSRDLRERVMIEWYRSELKKLIPAIIKKWEAVLGVSVSDWQVKWMKTKWGTCNVRDRRIWLNLELAKRPLRCLEYIVVHEMLHLIERTHNQVFIAHLDKHVPQWKNIRRELNAYISSYESWSH